MNPETILAHDEHCPYEGAAVPPIFQNSLFTFESWEAIDDAFSNRLEKFIYSRVKNPTVKETEKKIAAIAGGEKAQLFPSGMGAISAAILHCIKQGDHVIAVKNVYGPINSFLNKYLVEKMGIQVTMVDGKDPQDFRDAIRPNTALIFLESPSSAVFSLQDIPAVVAIAKEHPNIRTVIDNTWATPLFQRPLDMGVDLEIHSCSKYIGGHSDVVAGVVIGSAADIDSITTTENEWIGAKIAPFEAWLLLRSLRTLPIRLERHHQSALKVAQFLEAHPAIASVNYPALPSHPQHALAKSQMTGNTGLFGFTLVSEDLTKIKHFVNALTLFKIGVSWGGHESLVYVPAISYLKEMGEAECKNMGVSLNNIRISVGLEHPDDLIADLKNALL
jgi:cystathionine beta-lyase